MPLSFYAGIRVELLSRQRILKTSDSNLRIGFRHERKIQNLVAGSVPRRL